MNSLQRRSLFRQAGVTLIEMVITILVLSIAVATVTISIASMSARSADPMIQNRVIALAQTYAEEILTKRFDEASPPEGGHVADPCATLGPEGTEARATFNDVDDYNGLNDSPPADQQGNVLDPVTYANYQVSVVVDCDATAFSLPGTEAKRIDITVTPPHTSPMTFTVYRGNF